MSFPSSEKGLLVPSQSEPVISIHVSTCWHKRASKPQAANTRRQFNNSASAPDLAVCDFYPFRKRIDSFNKQWVAVTVVGANDLANEVIAIGRKCLTVHKVAHLTPGSNDANQSWRPFSRVTKYG
jgi:hypothetical protein